MWLKPFPIKMPQQESSSTDYNCFHLWKQEAATSCITMTIYRSVHWSVSIPKTSKLEKLYQGNVYEMLGILFFFQARCTSHLNTCIHTQTHHLHMQPGELHKNLLESWKNIICISQKSIVMAYLIQLNTFVFLYLERWLCTTLLCYPWAFNFARNVACYRK